jgi:Ca2+-binding EF-hand superfamily protein
MDWSNAWAADSLDRSELEERSRDKTTLTPDKFQVVAKTKQGERKKSGSPNRYRKSPSPAKNAESEDEHQLKKKAEAIRLKTLQRQMEREAEEMMAVLSGSQQRSKELERERTFQQSRDASLGVVKELPLPPGLSTKKRIAMKIMAAAASHPSFIAYKKKSLAKNQSLFRIAQEAKGLKDVLAERARLDREEAMKMEELNALPSWKRDEVQRKKKKEERKLMRSLSPEKRKELRDGEVLKSKADALRLKSLQRQMDREAEEMMDVFSGSMSRSSDFSYSVSSYNQKDGSRISVDSFGLEDWPDDFSPDSSQLYDENAVDGIQNATSLNHDLRNLTSEHIRSIFDRANANGSGLLNISELSDAVCELTGRNPSSPEVVAMRAASGAKANSLTADQFDHLIRTYDWDALTFFSRSSEDGRVAELAPSALQDASEQASEDFLYDVFTKYDVNESDDLDSFELSNAMTEVLGHSPTSAQISAMLEDSGASETGVLSLDQFRSLVINPTWKEAVIDESIMQHVAPTYEVDFNDSKLGFRVKNYPALGVVVVSRVEDPKLEGVVGVNDTIRRVNGAPLGFITDSRYLQERVSTLSRPVRITFERFVDVEGIFKKFASRTSEVMNVLNFDYAITEICGEQLSSVQVTALLQAAGVTDDTISMAQFLKLFGDFEWYTLAAVQAAPGTYEVPFRNHSLGFKVKYNFEQDALLVTHLDDAELSAAGLKNGDKVLSVNGVPLHSITDSGVSIIFFINHNS